MARAKKGRSKKKSNSISVNLSEVESAGRVSDGDHLATVASIEEKESSGGNPYLNWKLKVKGGVVYHTTSLQPQALWNLRGTLEACGYEIPDDEFDLDLDSLIDAELGVSIESEEYQGKRRPRIVEVFSVDDIQESEEEEEPDEEEPEEEEEEKPKKDKKGKKASKSKGKKKMKKGAEVEWEDDDETYTGTVTSIDSDGIVTVEDEEGDEWELEEDELTLI